MSVTPGIVKKVLHSGTGLLPTYNQNTKVFFNFEVLLPLVDVNKEGFPEDRALYKIIDDTRKSWPNGYGKPLELVFGKKFQLPVFETCITSMHTKEVSQFDIEANLMAPYPLVSKKLRDIARAEIDKNFDFNASQHHHCAAMGPFRTGYDELDDLLQNPRPLRVIFHLLEVQQPDQYRPDNWQLNDVDKFKRVEKLKEEGNTCFKEREYRAAIDKYRESLGLIEQLITYEKPGDEEWSRIDKMNVPLYLNLSQCYLNESEFRNADETASEVLKREPENEKALFRRARARILTWELDLAEEDLNKLIKAHPSTSNIVQQQREIIFKRRQEKEQTDKSVYKKMLQ